MLPHAVNMVVGTSIVASIEAPEMVPNEVNIVNGVPSDRKDFTLLSAEYKSRREKKLSLSRSTPERRRVSLDETFDALQAEIDQFADLLNLIEQGRLHHSVGLSARIRLMVCSGRPLPLLQLCAASIEEDLTVYVPPITTDEGPDLPLDGISFALLASTSPSALAKNPADLDVWLASPASVVRGKHLSQKDLLAQIGNTIGAHFDRDADPSVDALRSLETGAQLKPWIDYLCAVARMTIALASRLLVARSQRTP
jgi:hypothetical protein